ncbi:AbrB/MazE/SpoVT family DNA-binding domain-containing protein [Candidatus Daviesbacteria bacterium]|nr:AbrB/MazE/SpoVT family DNA-binding domain-containing protein [Candidatus Daviesbacteria bacterium]
MLAQKLYKNGNSIAVTVPKEYLKELNFRDGSEVVVQRRGQELVVISKKRADLRGVNDKFAKMVDEFMIDHKDVLQELAQR